MWAGMGLAQTERRGMKTFIFVSVLFFVLIFGGVSWKSTAASDVQKRRAVAEFPNPITVQGVAMNRGEACTFIYKGVAETRDNLVASFHCIHIERAKANNFIWRSRETAQGVMELVDFQFSGETAAHGVPVSGKVAVVPLVN
jgi:hypothetical protein